MKITFLGTGAADFSPLLETEYKNKLGLDQRRSSSILIEDQFLVDCGPHTLDSLRIQGLDASGITDLFVTHFHSDHYQHHLVQELASQTRRPLRIWHRAGAEPEPVEHGVFCPVEPGQEIRTEGLTVKPLAANHTQFPLHYDFELDGCRVFYGCDGAWLLYDTFYAMRGRHYHCMILDGTVGDYAGDFRLGEHNSIPMIRLMAATFRNEHVVAENGQIWLSHLARTLHKPHGETVALLKRDGLHAAYDGLTLQVP